MTMKKLLTLALAMLMVLSLAACGSSGTTTPSSNAANSGTSSEEGVNTTDITTVEPGKLILATNCQFPPYEMVADGEGFNGTGFEGIDVEIASAIADKLGLELQIDDMDFDSSLLAVQEGRSDILLAGLSYSEERDEVMDFTTKYATGVQVVIVKDGSGVTMDNLGDYMIGTQRGTTGFIYASDTPENGGYGEDHVIGYDSGVTAVQELINGTIDAVIIDNEPAKAYVESNPGLKILDTSYAEEDYAIGMNKSNTALLEAVNAALEELKADGTLQSIVDKYIKAE